MMAKSFTSMQKLIRLLPLMFIYTQTIRSMGNSGFNMKWMKKEIDNASYPLLSMYQWVYSGPFFDSLIFYITFFVGF